MGINPSYIQGYSSSIIGIINGMLVPALIALAFIVFLWGVYNYFILGAADETKRETGRVFVLYGVIGFVVIFSLWGIVNIFGGTLNLFGYNAPAPPTIGGGSTAPGTIFGSPVTLPGGGGFGGGTTVQTPAQQQATAAYYQCMGTDPTQYSFLQARCDAAYQQALGGAGGSTGILDSSCSSNADCASGLSCSSVTQTCQVTGGGTLGSCSETGASCYTSSGAVGTCGGNNICQASGGTSKNGSLGEDCTTAPCASGLVCDSGTQTCQTSQRKASGSACTYGDECESYACITDANGANGTCY